MSELSQRIDDLPQGPVADGPLDVSALTGVWLNTDRGSSGGVLQLEVRESGDGKLSLAGRGAGDREPYEWSEVSAPVFAFTVDGGTAWGFTCRWDFGFLSSEVAGYGKEGILIIVSYNSFQDDSGRCDYWTREFFNREDA